MIKTNNINKLKKPQNVNLLGQSIEDLKKRFRAPGSSDFVTSKTRFLDVFSGGKVYLWSTNLPEVFQIVSTIDYIMCSGFS